jgi:hypothetical protein
VTTPKKETVDYELRLVGLARETDNPWLRDAAARLEGQGCELRNIENILTDSDVPERLVSVFEGPAMTLAERVAWLVAHWSEAVEERDEALHWSDFVKPSKADALSLAEAERDALREVIQQISVFADRLIPQSLREALNAGGGAALGVEHERARVQDHLRRLINRSPHESR